MPYFGTFGIEFEKAIVISEISYLECLKNESLTHTVNFGIRSVFSESLGSGFSEGLGPGPDPLDKVWRNQGLVPRFRNYLMVL